MIPRDYITAWRARAPWVQDAQVEQDLIIARAIVAVFGQPALRRCLAFRGGTALYKLHLPPVRYSEDIDLVQVEPAPIGPTLDALRSSLDPWLGEPTRKIGAGTVTLAYRVLSEDTPALTIRLKVEINTREHFTAFGLLAREYAVQSRWFAGSATVSTYHLDELLGTKLRALYQRSKGRDLFDLWYAGTTAPVDADRVVDSFGRYLEHQGLAVRRRDFAANLAAKLGDPAFVRDTQPLLAAAGGWDPHAAVQFLADQFLSRLPA